MTRYLHWSAAVSLLIVSLNAHSASSIPHVFGVDEFGRDNLIALIQAIAFSTVKGSVLACLAFGSAVAMGGFAASSSRRPVLAVIKVCAAVIESLPGLLWVLILVAAVKLHTGVVIAFAFLVISVPGAAQLAYAEFVRLQEYEFVLAAKAIGCNNVRIVLFHILPNSWALLAPVFFQLLGNAIAISGAIGLLGLGSREDLDLGVFLYRGKEQFSFNPGLLLASLGCYVLLYVAVIALARVRATRSLARLD